MASDVRTTIRYDGPALAGHEIDVQELAPALLALADIIQIANRRFNGDAAAMRVLVKADVEQRCFQIDLHLVQSLVEQTKALFSEDHLTTAKQIAAWLGLGGATVGSLFRLLKFFGQKTAKPTTQFEIHAATGSTVVIMNGDGNSIEVPKQVLELASDKAVMDRAKTVLRPLELAGYEELSFVENGQQTVVLTKDEAVRIKDAPALEPAPLPEEVKNKITGPVRIKTPQYEGAAKWTVLSAGRPIDVTMPAEWLEEFQHNRVEAPPNSILDVEMEQFVRVGPDGVALGNPTYVVNRVLSVRLPEKQGAQQDWVSAYKAPEDPEEEPPITA
jgi:hypothetical protein